ITSRDFNQDGGRAKRAADKAPVIITDRGKPVYVLMRHDAYRRMALRGPSLAELLADPQAAEVEFEPPRVGNEILKVPDLS
ncbi:MAG: type II toxin-antitoxin system Phd/YefM family antitoxin, partial [Candidatus Eremiobacteraeota bacterium]|nr:type II toxin-antitoxin system Phd/YefM family antitoxin [Candidatus Eremiobacteraeota bacterium]